MKIVLIALAICLFVGCSGGTPMETEVKNNGYEVELLFHKDGCSVYRFRDYGERHYFVTRSGQVMSTQTEGKTTREEVIITNE